MNKQKLESESTSPAHDPESSPSPSKKKLTIHTVVSDKPQPARSQKTLSERCVPYIVMFSLFPAPRCRIVTGHFSPPWFLSPLFSSHLACYKYNIPGSISHKTEQGRFKCNIPRFTGCKPKQVRFKYNIPRSKNRGLSNRGEITLEKRGQGKR